MDWKLELDKKEKERNLTKGEENGHSISSGCINSRNSSRSSNNVHRISVHKEINNIIERGGSIMITVDGALKDLEAIEKEATDNGAKVVVKALKVVVKFLSTMRSNQLLTEEEKANIHKEKEARKAKEVK
jgi:hypothetical protein